MLKVCHLISGDLWAGAEVMAYHLLKGLKKYPDLKLSVILLNEGRLSEEIRKTEIPVYIVDETNLSLFQVFLNIRRIIYEKDVDIIHSHRYKENLLAYFVSKTITGLQLIGTQHGMPEIIREKKKFKHQLMLRFNFSLLSKSFRFVVVVSRDIEKVFIEKYRFSSDKIKVIHNGVEIFPKSSVTTGNKPFVIGSAGRFFPIKDFPLLIEIAREVSGKGRKILFKLAGDGPNKEDIEVLIRRYRLEKVVLLKGFVPDISKFYNGLDLYMNTSVHEGIPMSVLEAMAQGLPVIAPKVGGLPEILEDGVQGFLIKDRNPKDFAEKCIELYEKKELKTKMGIAAKEKVARDFSMLQMSQRYYSLYRPHTNLLTRVRSELENIR